MRDIGVRNKIMESGVQTVQKKKQNKIKLKKTIKNVLCRPDPLQWPVLSDEHKKSLETALSMYKIDLPEMKKLHWKELKLIPKEKRPKTPKIKKHDGILFGITECMNAIKEAQCSGVLIESMVNPRVIVQPLIETCIEAKIPVICLQNLRKTSENYFGIPTSSLGVRCNYLQDLANVILQIAECYNVSQNVLKQENTFDAEMVPMSTIEDAKFVCNKTVECPYLYRTGRTRVFIPSGDTCSKATERFTGQSYIEFTETSNKNKAKTNYKKMMLKRVASNPNRAKVK